MNSVYQNVIVGVLLVQMVRQSIQISKLRRQVWDNEVALHAIAAQLRGLAAALGYTVVLPWEKP